MVKFDVMATTPQEQEQRPPQPDRSSYWSGIFIVMVGAALFLNMFVQEPEWLFSWPMLLMALGVYLGFKNGFEGAGWLIALGIGAFFLIDEYFVDISIGRYFWPLAIIAVGLMMILRPRRHRRWEEKWQSRWEHKWQRRENRYYRDHGFTPPPPPPASNPVQDAEATVVSEPSTAPSAETMAATQSASSTTNAYNYDEVLDIAAIFGSAKKIVYSKQFRGGEIVSVFGGADVNLLQAGLATPQVIIESVQIFGGAKLIIPSDWSVVNESVAVFGGIEDKRPMRTQQPAGDKVIILKGFVLFGGIEIKSF